jgi:hypothetical protein
MNRNSDDRVRPYLFSYGHDGARWQFEILATSPEDARARVSKLAYASYDGELIAKLPAHLGLAARMLVGVRNLFAH